VLFTAGWNARPFSGTVIVRKNNCFTILAVNGSYGESMRSDRSHGQTITNALPRHELVQLPCGAVQVPVLADGDDLARAA
jgi:hypothetical protein